jgi:hypothetical protein
LQLCRSLGWWTQHMINPAKNKASSFRDLSDGPSLKFRIDSSDNPYARAQQVTIALVGSIPVDFTKTGPTGPRQIPRTS